MSILELQHVTKTFGGLVALNNLSMHVQEGEILGVIGPNGAGKTTLFNVISGFSPPESGTVIFQNRNITRVHPDRICHLGIARTFQLTRVFPNMTVLQNVQLGYLYGKKGRKIGDDDTTGKCRDILVAVGLEKYENNQAKILTYGQKKRLEVSRAVATEPRLLLLDEVMVGLNPIEITEMTDFMKTLVRERGITVMMIEHVMKAVMGVSNRITVLTNGQKLTEGTPQEVVTDTRVVAAYLGERYHHA